MKTTIRRGALAALMLSASTLWAGNLPEVTVPTDVATIQEAVDIAAEGGTITVLAGVYQETLTISTPGLTLNSEGAILDAEYTGDGVTIQSDGVTLHGFTILNGRRGIVVRHADLSVPTPLVEISIDENIVRTTLKAGIDVFEAEVRITNNVVEGSRETAISVEIEDALLTSLVAGNSVRLGEQSGLQVSGAVDPVVEQNTVSSCGGTGIFVRSASNFLSEARMLNNVVENCRSDGILLDVPEGSAEVLSNRSSANGGIGLLVSADAPSVLRGNITERNSFGMGVTGSFSVSRCRSMDNLNMGFDLVVTNGLQGEFSNNVSHGNGTDGVFAVAFGDLLIRNNRIFENLQDGVKVGYCEAGTALENNQIRQNGHQGISNDGQDLNLIGNTVKDNGVGLGPDIAGMGLGAGTIALFVGNLFDTGGIDTPDRL
ncbi:MAG: hypothetical protein DHS20C15_16570 [Planctomycetota bacterium]|nr:MAG: hypothetical protein DHS20C15_16570 [Planctomycetota bacterium]